MSSITFQRMVVILTLLLAGCGRENQGPYVFETEEIALDRNVLTDLPLRSDREAGRSYPRAAMNAGGVLWNALAGVAQKLFPSDGPTVSAGLLGHGLPSGKSPMDMLGCRTEGKAYKKKLKSLIGADLIVIEYAIGYEYGCKSSGAGSYLANVRFRPTKIKVDALWNLKITSVSDAPINFGTAQAPVAGLKFAITFTGSGIGSRTTTDDFSVEAKNGSISVVERQFD